MNKIFVMHTNHNDSLWKRPRADYAEIECDILNKVLDLMDRDPDFTYFAEQSLMLHDFLAVYPDRAEALRRRIREGRFEVCGGAWVITDLNMVSGESILRNFMLGLAYCRGELGTEVPTGCFADAFGQPAQMPQILQSFGMRTVLPGRCASVDPEAGARRGSPFVWRAPDGSEVLAGVDAGGIYIGNYEPTSSARLESDMPKSIEALQNRPAAILYIGSEELVPRWAIFRKLKALAAGYPASEFLYSTVRDYYAETQKLIREGVLAPKVHEGEFNPTFTGCYTTRSAIKHKNAAMQAALFEAESLRAALRLGGAPAGENFGGVWEKVILNQFHDALCGCISPCAYRDVMDRYAAAEEELARALRRMSGDREPRAFFNPLPRARGGVAALPDDGRAVSAGGEVPPQAALDGVLYVKLPPVAGLGSVPFERVPGRKPEELRPCDAGIQNEYYRVSVRDGVPEIFSEASGLSLRGAGLPVIREDAGGFWSARPTGRERALAPGWCRAERGGPLSRIVVGGCAEGVPWDESLRCEWELELRLFEGTDRVDLLFRADWHGRASALSAAFPLPFGCGEAAYDAPFHVVSRSPYAVNGNDDKGGEWPSLRFVSASDGPHGLTVFHLGCHGVLHRPDALLVNLLRAPVAPEYGIICRNGFHDAGVLPDSVSLEEGRHEFRLALRLHRGGWREAGVLASAEDFLQPLAAAPLLPELPGLTLDAPPSVGVSAIKPSEDGRGIVVRLWEAAGEGADCALTVPGGREAFLCTPEEEPLEPLACTDGRIALRAGPHKIVSVLVHR